MPKVRHIPIIPVSFLAFLGLAAGCAHINIDQEEGFGVNSDREPASAVRRSEPEDQVDAEALRLRDARERHDLILGMDRDDVLSIWGDPREVQVAGDARLGNERWIYPMGLSSPWSLGQSRVVYFESGRVVGWETH
jgi:hypothetical protein